MKITQSDGSQLLWSVLWCGWWTVNIEFFCFKFSCSSFVLGTAAKERNQAEFTEFDEPY